MKALLSNLFAYKKKSFYKITSNLMKTNKRVYKIVLIGTQKVGKTSLLKRFNTSTFDENSTSPTVGANFIIFNFNIDGKEVSCQLWDTAGEERYKSLSSIYYRESDCGIAVFDVNDKESFWGMDGFIEEFINNNSNDNFLVIAGNKIDILGSINDIDPSFKESCDKKGYKLLFTSAKTGEGVDDLFNSVVREICARKRVDNQVKPCGIESKDNVKPSCC